MERVPNDAVRAVNEALKQIAARDRDIQAWEYIDAAGAKAQAANSAPARPLYGFTLGVKDLFDVGGMPTTWGSPIYAGNIAVRDSACVAIARAAGAIVLGKTVTTEFAYVAPSRTRNPWNVQRTPGGSSSGSAAAVADGHVRAAFGSQTMGSVLRPAAFCGVVGYKPTFATMSLDGAHAIAPSFDTLGWMTRSVEDAARVRWALLGLAPRDLDGPVPSFGLLRTPAWPKAQPAMQALVEEIATAFDAPEMHFGFDDFDEVFFPIANFEMRQSLATEDLQHFERLRPQTQKLVRSTEFDYNGAEAARRRLARFDADAAFGSAGVLLMAASTGEAPDLSTTGDPVFNRLASLLGLPAITVPIKLGPAGLPLGVQLIARQHDDEALLRAARAVERRFPFSAVPPAR